MFLLVCLSFNFFFFLLFLFCLRSVLLISFYFDWFLFSTEYTFMMMFNACFGFITVFSDRENFMISKGNTCRFQHTMAHSVWCLNQKPDEKTPLIDWFWIYNWKHMVVAVWMEKMRRFGWDCFSSRILWHSKWQIWRLIWMTFKRPTISNFCFATRKKEKSIPGISISQFVSFSGFARK